MTIFYFILGANLIVMGAYGIGIVIGKCIDRAHTHEIFTAKNWFWSIIAGFLFVVILVMLLLFSEFVIDKLGQ